MNGRVTTRAPACAKSQLVRMIHSSDQNAVGTRECSWLLSVAFETEIVVPFDQHPGVDRAVWIVANGATFTQRLMLEDIRPRLLAVALGAAFIQPAHFRSARWVHNIETMRIVALHTIHVPFDYGMTMRQIKFRMRLLVTAEARARIFAGINNEFTQPSSTFDVLAARTMTRFAARITGFGTRPNSNS